MSPIEDCWSDKMTEAEAHRAKDLPELRTAGFAQGALDSAGRKSAKVSLSEAKPQLGKLIAEAHLGVEVVLTNNGTPAAVLMPYGEYLRRMGTP